jgi:hypothetical protein
MCLRGTLPWYERFLDVQSRSKFHYTLRLVKIVTFQIKNV